MCRILSPASGFFFLPPAGNFLPIAAESHRRRQKKNELPYICPQDKPPPPHTSNFYKFFIFLRLCQNFLIENADVRMQNQIFLTKCNSLLLPSPKIPEKSPFLRLARHLLLLWADGPQTAEFMFHSSSEERTTYGVFTYPIGHRSPSAGHPPGGHHTPGRAVSVHCRVRRRRDAVRR